MQSIEALWTKTLQGPPVINYQGISTTFRDLPTKKYVNIKNNPNHHPWNPQFESSIYMFLCVHLLIYLKKPRETHQKKHSPALYENVHLSKVTPFFKSQNRWFSPSTTATLQVTTRSKVLELRSVSFFRGGRWWTASLSIPKTYVKTRRFKGEAFCQKKAMVCLKQQFIPILKCDVYIYIYVNLSLSSAT